MIFKPVSTIKVGIDFGKGPLDVGRLAIRDRIIYFEYERSFIERGLEISPLRLPLQPGLKSFDAALFDGLPGVFNDSPPDGWGRLLFDRALRAQGLMPAQASPLDRLAHVGAGGMGALTYEPAIEADAASDAIDLDWLAGQALEVLEGQADEVIGELLTLNGSSAGARPKAMIGYNPKTGAMTHGRHDLPKGFEPWLVKFPNTQDGKDSGAIEYVYALMAHAAGVEMTETHLFPAKRGAGFFATRRFAEASGNRTANYTHAVLRRIYNFGIREEWVEMNPAQFPQLYQHRSRDRVLSEAEIRLFWQTWSVAKTGGKLGVSEPIAIALQLCLATLQRAGEVIGMHTDELDWTTRSWVIASERSKNRRAHHVPLSPLSQQLIRRALSLATATEVPEDIATPLPRLVADYRGYVFPAIHGNGPVDRHVVTRAMSRIREKLDIDNATAHDLRRTGASMMASERCGVRGEVIARILNHTPLGSPVTRIYNRYDYAAEKRAALELWANTLLKISSVAQSK